MFISIWPPVVFMKTVRDIPRHKRMNDSSAIKDVRSNFRIISIDDEAFLHKRSLSEMGFNVGYYDQIENIAPGDGGQIFLCDILGLQTNSQDQGARTMKELRRRHPVAPVIAYTHLMPTDRRYQAARDVSDVIIRKSDSIDNLTDVLDDIISQLNDPSQVWIRIRRYLNNRGVDTKKIALIEHYYAKSIIKEDLKIFRKGVSSTLRSDTDDLIDGTISIVARGALSSAQKAITGMV